MSPTTDPSVPNREASSLAPNPTGTPALSNQDILQAVEEPPPYTPRPDLRTGEATVEYGPARPFQAAPPPPQHGAQGGWPPPQPHHQQQQYRPPPPPQRWAGNAGYPGAMRRDQIPGGWPPPQQQQQQWGPPTAGPGLQPRPSIYGVFRDGAPARGSQIPPSPTRGGSTAPPAQNAKDAAPSAAGTGSASSELEDARPTTSPVPGHPFLRNGQILVYPSSFECHKCLNTGYKNFDPHHPCRGCWEKYGKPYTGAITYAPFTAGGSSHSQISLQRPLPRQPPPGPAPPHSAPATVHGHMPGAYPSRPWMPAPPPGATVVQPGDPRIGGRLCYRCMGEGTISVFIFDTAQCPACGGLGRILG